MLNEQKWQRIQYMPGFGIGENGQRVTGCKEHIELSRKAAAQGMVLLKNNDSILPLKNGKRIAVFGKAQADYVKGGGGSGDVIVAYVRSILEGLEIKQSEGKLTLFSPLSDFYRGIVNKQRTEGKAPGFTIEPELPRQLLREAREFADTALITICRFSSEGWDRTGEPFDGDFYLSHEEDAMVKAVLEEFDNVIAVLNIGGMMDTLWFKNEPKIKGALLAWQGGMEGGLATADILCGDESPSGHLTDTFAVNFKAYPSSEHFSDSNDYVEYNEDIYIGYRYFETVPGAAEKVSYPFGFGLSYTDFCLSETYATTVNNCISVHGTITNAGACEGRQVFQIYCEAPQGLLGKPKKVLVGFKKTKLLKPDESEELVVDIDPYSFSSYDDIGAVAKSAYVLESGKYYFHVGFNVRDTQKLDFSYEVKENTILKQLSEKCAPKQLHKRMLDDGTYAQVEADDTYPRPDDDLSVLPFPGQAPSEHTWETDYCIWFEPVGKFLIDVYNHEMSLDEFMGLLSDEMKIHLLCGQPNRGPANTFGFGNIPKYGIPNAMTADGPAGLRFCDNTGIKTTAFPVACLLAATWDPDLIYEVESAIAEEVHENGIGTWLAPAIKETLIKSV